MSIKNHIHSKRPDVYIHEITDDACLYNTQVVPPTWSPCCKEFALRTKECAYEVRYEYHDGWWGIRFPDVASSDNVYVPHVKITYCPHCGQELSTDFEKRVIVNDN